MGGPPKYRATLTSEHQSNTKMSSAGWYNDAAYSDIRLKLRDGRQIAVHKLVLCTRNKYFDSLCGSNSAFAEAKQNVIELKEDDPDALEEVLRKLYDCELPPAETKTWRFWLQLMATADTYLEPELAVRAFFALRDVAQKVEDPDQIFDIIQSIEEKVGHVYRYQLFGEGLRKKNLDKLLKNQRFREFITSDKKLMLSLMDEVEAPRNLSERRYALCGEHEDQVFQDRDMCVWCSKISSTRTLISERSVAFSPTT